jgi:hypothetical protein
VDYSYQSSFVSFLCTSVTIGMSLCAAHVEFTDHCFSCATVRCSVPPIGKGYGSICNLSPVCLSVCLSLSLSLSVYLPTWSRVLPEKPLVFRLAKQIATFCHPKVYYRVHKRPSLAAVFNQITSVHAAISFHEEPF